MAEAQPKRHNTFRRRKKRRQDRISELPDDILLHVMSSLRTKEVVRMSLLSKRWRHVGSYLPTLNFGYSHISHNTNLAKKAYEIETPKYTSLEASKPKQKQRYVRGVDQVVSSHNAPTIEEFRIHCALPDNSGASVDNWVRFAIQKRVKSLDLDFSSYLDPQYVFLFTYPTPPPSYGNSLTSLQLSGLNVTGETLEICLRNCPLLEFLSVKDVEELVELKVVGHSLKLKYLILYYCFWMQHLEISAPNLVYFNYFGPKISVPFKSTPKLSELTIGGDYGNHVSNNFMEHASYLSQLETLTLNLLRDMEHIMQSVEFPELTRLKKLEVRLEPLSFENLFSIRRVLRACPNLQKFVLQLNVEPDYDEKDRKLKKKKGRPHEHLKIVEIIGFTGMPIDLEFAMYLLNIAVTLEKIIVNPRKISEITTPFLYRSPEKKRSGAKQLGAYLLYGTDLVIY